ncbi:uncharacterized protein PFL1_04353 [Pseudozyma flocculosa PF-1]|uniref:F-box domain-containing protein n=2 Tax=Pseudozyma flocculosa TaxID=84751 RepID=A0A5C3FBE6_9BASI|nr:uncharacterized protein PFL1_04353 [Pseudozyma flocculosa PF-1]EPQ28026.1 hypothetical protein PFL1_04353 [Pseudozyma flocculosa PF-1]SPO41580.1 uncharacterized protein PSFLO_07062 [Pseudozyma flocculosa]
MVSAFDLVLGPGAIPASAALRRQLSSDSPALSRCSTPLQLSSPSPLLRLPPEIIELIAVDLDELADLVALASTCRDLCALIRPHHIGWYRICCGLDEATLWSHLADHPRLASNVRCLVLDSRRPPHIPDGLQNAAVSRPSSSRGLTAEKKNEELLIAAVERMVNLRKLVFRIRPPLSGDDFWSRLWRACPRLEDVECADSCGRTGTSSDERQSIHGSTFFECSGLKRLVWCSSYVPSDPASIIAELGALETSLVQRCPDLEELRIQYTDVRVRNAIYGGTLMAHAHWPKLRVLELSRFHAGDEEAVAAFFERHPQLEVLKVDQVDATTGRYIYLDNISDHALPRLHTFWGGIDNAISVLSSPLRPIRRIRGVQFDTVMLGARRLANWTSTPQGQCLLEGLAQAQHLEEVDGEFAVVVSDKLDLIRLFEACKRIRILRLRCNVAGFLETYLPAFAALQQLEVLQFPLHQLDILQRPPASGSLSLRYHGSSDTFVATLKQKARLVAAVCPKLSKIDFGASGGMAKVIRYDNSPEVSEIVLADGEEGAEDVDRELELTRMAAARIHGG